MKLHINGPWIDPQLSHRAKDSFSPKQKLLSEKLFYSSKTSSNGERAVSIYVACVIDLLQHRDVWEGWCASMPVTSASLLLTGSVAKATSLSVISSVEGVSFSLSAPRRSGRLHGFQTQLKRLFQLESGESSGVIGTTWRPRPQPVEASNPLLSLNCQSAVLLSSS